MRVVALEEHFAFPDLYQKANAKKIAAGWAPPKSRPATYGRGSDLEEIDAIRLGSMDAAGITVQVLSFPLPGADSFERSEGIAFAIDQNDRLARVIVDRSERFAAFAHLYLSDPDAAADELERAVRELGFCGALISGMVGSKFLDDPMFAPLLSRAEALDVPIYIHPARPPLAVGSAYYSDLPGVAGFVLETGGWGWHSETALHVLRMAAAGTFERHRGLKIIVGHMGEGLPFMLDRTDRLLSPILEGNSRDIKQTITDQVWITTAGIFTQPPFLCALQVFGADRILFSVDYPYSSNAEGREFLDSLSLSGADMEKICFRNADRLLRLGSAI